MEVAHKAVMVAWDLKTDQTAFKGQLEPALEKEWSPVQAATSTHLSPCPTTEGDTLHDGIPDGPVTMGDERPELIPGSFCQLVEYASQATIE